MLRGFLSITRLECHNKGSIPLAHQSGPQWGKARHFDFVPPFQFTKEPFRGLQAYTSDSCNPLESCLAFMLQFWLTSRYRAVGPPGDVLVASWSKSDN